MISVHKYINEYWVQELPNGVILLVINLIGRECLYHRFNDNMYLICETQEEYDNWSEDLIFRPDDFLPKNPDVLLYMKSSAIEKDQLTFTFSPYYKEWSKQSKKYIIE